MGFISFYNSHNTQFVMNISKFQFQIYKTSRFKFGVFFYKEHIVFVLGFFGFQFFFRDSHKDWLGRYDFEKTTDHAKGEASE